VMGVMGREGCKGRFSAYIVDKLKDSKQNLPPETILQREIPHPASRDYTTTRNPTPSTQHPAHKKDRLYIYPWGIMAKLEKNYVTRN